jgi:hypothetical protein
VAEWKAIAARRLDVLDEENCSTQRGARAYLAGALRCRYDHPATECKIMGAEIDRRLAGFGPGETAVVVQRSGRRMTPGR